MIDERKASWTPSIDVLVSTFNEERHIERCIRSIVEQDYVSEKVEVTVIDGGSTDGTVPLLRSLAALTDRIRIVADGRRRNLPEALNLGVRLTSGELVAKIDAHGYPALDFLRLSVDAFRAHDEAVACVGGTIEQRGETPFGDALSSARTSRFGVGGSRYASSGGREVVDTVQCGVYRRDPLVAVGSFDPRMPHGEDEELNWRLRRAGYAILFDPRMTYHYVARDSWREAFRQYRNYGRARVRVVRKHPSYLRPYHLAPAGALGVGAGLLAAAPRNRVARWALASGTAGYVGVAAVTARGVSSESGARPSARIVAAFVALHAGYGLGSLEELGRLALPTFARRSS